MGHVPLLDQRSIDLKPKPHLVKVQTHLRLGTVKLMPNRQSWRGRSYQVGQSY
jgi:hypothetical protein